MSEGKVNSDMDKEWNWLKGYCNLADMDTRTAGKQEDFVAESDSQEGIG